MSGRSPQGGSLAHAHLDQARRRLADAEARLRRHQAAIEAGVDPAAIVDVINQAQAERAAARADSTEDQPRRHSRGRPSKR